MSYSYNNKKISVNYIKSDGTREQIIRIPRVAITNFRSKMLEVEATYPQEKKKHYTEHTKNSDLAMLEAALEYLEGIVKKLEGRRVDALQLKAASENARFSHNELSSLLREEELTFRQISAIVKDRKAGSQTTKNSIYDITCICAGLKERIGDYDLKLEEFRLISDPEGYKTAHSTYIKIYDIDDKDSRMFSIVGIRFIEAFLRKANKISKKLGENSETWLSKKPANADEARKFLDGRPENIRKILELSMRDEIRVKVEKLNETGKLRISNYSISEIEEAFGKWKLAMKDTEKMRSELDAKLKKRRDEMSKKGIHMPSKVSTEIDLKKLKEDLDEACALLLSRKPKMLGLERNIEICLDCEENFYSGLISQMDMTHKLWELKELIKNAKKKNEIAQAKLEKMRKLDFHIVKSIEKFESLCDIAKMEIGRTKSKLRIKNVHRKNHLEYSPKVKGDAKEIGERRKAYQYPPFNGNSERQLSKEEYIEVIENQIIKLAEQEWSYFEDFAQGNSRLKKYFCTKLSVLAKLYVMSGGTFIQNDIKKRATNYKLEWDSPANGGNFSLMRIGFARRNFYRMIMDLQNPESPVIYYVGDKKNSQLFMSGGKYVYEKERAKKNGRLYVFGETLKPAVSAYNRLREKDPYFDLFENRK